MSYETTPVWINLISIAYVAVPVIVTGVIFLAALRILGAF